MPMAGRSPARFLAPIALIAVVFALYTVVHDTSATDPGKGGAETTQPTATATKSAAKKSSKKKRKMYTVKAGDTPSGIAAKAGISLEELEQLNPNLDPQSLSPGQRLRLSK
jgi:LysM repeat protein